MQEMGGYLYGRYFTAHNTAAAAAQLDRIWAGTALHTAAVYDFFLVPQINAALPGFAGENMPGIWHDNGAVPGRKWQFDRNHTWAEMPAAKMGIAFPTAEGLFPGFDGFDCRR